jgi:hypothetical protein
MGSDSTYAFDKVPLAFLQDSGYFVVSRKRWQSPVKTTLAFLFPLHYCILHLDF